MNTKRVKLISNIETPRLILRPIALSDAEVYFEAEKASMKELLPYWSWAKFGRSINDIKKFIRNALEDHEKVRPAQLFFSVFSKKYNKFLGIIWFFEINWYVPYFEIDGWLDTRETGKGYMTEAINALSRACFLVNDAKRIQAKIFVNHNISKSILARLKFKQEGEMENYFYNFSTRKITNGLLYSCCSVENLPPLEIKVE